MYIAYLNPKSSFLGESIHSDTLFGAICWGIANVCGDNLIGEVLEYFKDGKPPFLISSAFPYVQLEQRIHLLPKPICKPIYKEARSREDFTKLKAIKEIVYVPEEIFQQIIEGKLTDETLFNSLELAGFEYPRRGNKSRKYNLYRVNGSEYIQIYNMIIKNMGKIPIRVFQSMDVQRNVIERLSGTTTEGGLFYTEEMFFGKNAGLYFLVKILRNEISGNKLEDMLNSALRFIQDRGIGGDVSVGKGHFEVEFLSRFNWVKELTNPNAFTTLSLYYPADEFSSFSSNRERMWYKSVKRKGKVEASFVDVKNVWKESLMMFSEGSTFPLRDKEIYGRNHLSKKEEYEIQHYGFAFPVKIRMGEK
jgi:CRISPR-associated protein Csm4